MLSWAKTVIKTKYKPKYFLQSEITVSLWAGNLWACINHSTWYKTEQKTELLFLNLYNNLFYALSVFASWNSFFINPVLYTALSKIKKKKNYPFLLNNTLWTWLHRWLRMNVITQYIHIYKVKAIQPILLGKIMT